jgi:hypothetical protein
MSSIRTLAWMENPLFSQASMSVAPAATSRRSSLRDQHPQPLTAFHATVRMARE